MRFWHRLLIVSSLVATLDGASFAQTPMSLVDFKTDQASLVGKDVSILGIVFAESDWLILSDETFQLRVIVGMKKLNRDTRRQLFSECAGILHPCRAVVAGVVTKRPLAQIDADKVGGIERVTRQ